MTYMITRTHDDCFKFTAEVKHKKSMTETGWYKAPLDR